MKKIWKGGANPKKEESQGKDQERMTLGCAGRFGKHSIQEPMNESVVPLLHSVKPLRVLLSSHNTFYFGFMVSIFEASHSYKDNVNCSLKHGRNGVVPSVYEVPNGIF